MPRRDQVGTQTHGVIKEGFELDFSIAEHIGIGGAACLIFAQELCEHSVFVFTGEVNGLDIDAH